MAAVSWLCVFLSGAQAARLPIRIFTSADGLGSSFVDFIYRDSRGFMWFCTRDGLSRFDGSQFVTYQVGEKDSAPGIESIYETRDGMYWISTTGGTYRLDPSVASQPETSRPRLNAELITAEPPPPSRPRGCGARSLASGGRRKHRRASLTVGIRFRVHCVPCVHTVRHVK